MIHYLALPPIRPRLLIPVSSRKSQAASFILYAPGSTHGKMLKAAGRLLAQMGLFKRLGPVFSVSPESIRVPDAIRPIMNSDVIEALHREWEILFNIRKISSAFFLGTPNQFQKVIALLFDDTEHILSIAKIGATPLANQLILHESKTLAHLQRLPLPNGIIPALIGYGTHGPIAWMLQSILPEGFPSPNELRQEHVHFLSDLASSTYIEAPLHHLSFWNPIENANPQLRTVRDRKWTMVSAHGDFAPWNIRITNGKLAVCDWENYLPLAPAGWDLMRFIFMTEHLIRKQPIDRIYQQVLAGRYDTAIHQLERFSGIPIANIELLARLFVLDMKVRESQSYENLYRA